MCTKILNRLAVKLDGLERPLFINKELSENPCAGPYLKYGNSGAAIYCIRYGLSNSQIRKEVLA